MISALQQLAQYSSDYSYSYSSTTSSGDAGSAVAALMVVGITFFIIFLAYIFVAVCLMKIYKKAGRSDAWAAWVPIYQTWVYFELAGKPGWWAFPSLISPLNLVLGIIGSMELAKAFGKDATFGVILALLPVIGLPMLAFGDATYRGVPATQPTQLG